MSPAAAENGPVRPFSHAELAVADAVGSLMELWGFRRQLGRLWAVLFLSEKPLAAPALCDRLQISTGLLSMSLAELRGWGVVRPVNVPGDRKEHYEAETNVWKMVRRVLAEREHKAVEEALAAFDLALREVKAARVDQDAGVRAAAKFKVERLEQLVALARTGLAMLDSLLQAARADAGPLRMLSEMLGRRRS